MKETPEQMESEARSLILYILDADRRGAPASDILATVARRLAALVAAQRERDAMVVVGVANALPADVDDGFYAGYKHAIAQALAAIRA